VQNMKIENVFENPYAVVSVLGMRGCGKTWLVAHVAPPCFCFYIDTVGAFRGYIEGCEVLDIDAMPSRESFIKVLKEVVLNTPKVKDDKKLIIDISMLRREDMVMIMDWFSDALLYNLPGKWAVFADEVGEFLEQERGFYSTGFERLVRIGRNKGIMYIVMITQRPQKVNKHAITLSDYYAVFKFVHNLDIAAVRDILGMGEKEFIPIEMDIKGQKVGEYMLTDGISMWWFKRHKKEAVVYADGEVAEKQRTLVAETSDKPIEKREEPDSKPTHFGKHRMWTSEEVTTLKKLVKADMKHGDIARQLGRKVSSVSNKIAREKL